MLDRLWLSRCPLAAFAAMFHLAAMNTALSSACAAASAPKLPQCWRPRGARSQDALAARRARALELGFLRPRPGGARYVAVPNEVVGEAKMLIKATLSTRALELSTGLHRRSGSDLCAAALAAEAQGKLARL